MNAAPTLPIPAKSPFAFSNAGAAAAVFHRAMPRVIVPMAMATLGRIFCQVQKLSLGSVVSASAAVLARGVARVSVASLRFGVVTVVAAVAGPSRLSGAAAAESATSRLGAPLAVVVAIIGRSSAESVARSLDARDAESVDENESRELIGVDNSADSRVVFERERALLGASGLGRPTNEDGVRSALVKLIFFSVLRDV